MHQKDMQIIPKKKKTHDGDDDYIQSSLYHIPFFTIHIYTLLFSSINISTLFFIHSFVCLFVCFFKILEWTHTQKSQKNKLRILLSCLLVLCCSLFQFSVKSILVFFLTVRRSRSEKDNIEFGFLHVRPFKFLKWTKI